MYSGFISTRKVVNRLGIHQRFNAAGYLMIKPFLNKDLFPSLRDIQSFEGLNGPDGLKLKSPGIHEPSHLYDPINDTGEVPMHITNHYNGMVDALKKEDMVRAAFEASWLAHYVCDGLTPAHHFPLEEKMLELRGIGTQKPTSPLRKALQLNGDEPMRMILQRSWAMWGGKGLMSTHMNFEVGVATALLFYKINAPLDPVVLAQARRQGMLEFFKSEARAVASLQLYERFYKEGWNIDIARIIKDVIAPKTAQAIGIIWLLGYLDAGLESVIGVEADK